MKQIPTDTLDRMLEELGTDEIDAYFKENSEYLVNAGKAFSYYMKDVLAEKNSLSRDGKIKLKDIYSFAGVSEKYGEKIMNMEAHTANRDLILRFCIAGRFTLDEINRALKLYGMRPLYAKDKRDACLIVAIHRKVYDMAALDEILEKEGFLKLSADIK